MMNTNLWPIAAIHDHFEIGNFLNIRFQKMFNACTSRWKQAGRITVDFICNDLIFGAELAHIINHLFGDSIPKWI